MKAVKVLKGQVFDIFLLAALCAELWMVLDLVWHTETDRGQRYALLRRHQPDKLRVGDKLPSLNDLRYLSGKAKTVNISQKGAWLIFTDDCTDCSASWLEYVQSLQKENGDSPCYVILRTKDRVKESVLKGLSHLSFFLDVDGRAVRAMHVQFLPRLYVVGSDMRLRYVQSFDERIFPALESAQRLMEVGGKKP